MDFREDDNLQKDADAATEDVGRWIRRAVHLMLACRLPENTYIKMLHVLSTGRVLAERYTDTSWSPYNAKIRRTREIVSVQL